MNILLLELGNNGSSTSGIIHNIANSSLISTTDLPDDHAKIDARNRSVLFIIAPLVTIGIIAVLTAMILLFLRKKRLDKLRHRLMPFYTFEPGEEEDWETELLDDDSDASPRKFQGYKSMEYSMTNGHHKQQIRLE